MTLVLDPLPTGSDPWTKVVTALAGKIGSTDLSFVKYLAATGHNDLSVFTNIGETSEKVWEPTADQCPAVVLTAEASPGGDDHGPGQEVWYLDVGVDMKIMLPEGAADRGFQACYELVRTIHAGWRQGLANDPLSALPEVADYGIDGEIIPRVVSAGVGRYTARCFFILRFRIADTILG